MPTKQLKGRKQLKYRSGPHQLASVPPRSLAKEYVSRKITDKQDFEIFEYAHLSHTNVLIEGPTGPGKTTSVMAYAARGQYPFYAVPSNVGVEPSQLFGKYIPDGAGSFIWQDGPVTDLVRHGGVLLINEVNFLPPRVATVLFGLLDRRREITLLDHKAEVIRAHKDLLIVADMNPDYSGTQPLNQAFRNRFGIQLDWDYDEEVEASLVASKGLRELAGKLRKEYAAGRIFTPVSTNMLQEFERVHDFSPAFAHQNFVNHFHPDERPSITKVLQTYAENIRVELTPEDDDPVVFVDTEGLRWTQKELDALREKNYDNPDYIDPEHGKVGVGFHWEDE